MFQCVPGYKYGDWEFEVKDPNGYILVFSELID